jgi:hypothetical protein
MLIISTSDGKFNFMALPFICGTVQAGQAKNSPSGGSHLCLRGSAFA